MVSVSREHRTASNDLSESITRHRFTPVMILSGESKQSHLPGVVGPGFRAARRYANPPAATLLTGQAARERAQDAGCILCLVCSSSEEMVDDRCSVFSRIVVFARRQSHQLRRCPSQCRARPSAIRVSPIEDPFRSTIRNFRPLRSSSRDPVTRENAPALRSPSRRYFAASPSLASRGQRGGLSSGVSMSAIRIF
jgi:hypothetical protein